MGDQLLGPVFCGQRAAYTNGWPVILSRATKVHNYIERCITQANMVSLNIPMEVAVPFSSSPAVKVKCKNVVEASTTNETSLGNSYTVLQMIDQDLMEEDSTKRVRNCDLFDSIYCTDTSSETLMYNLNSSPVTVQGVKYGIMFLQPKKGRIQWKKHKFRRRNVKWKDKLLIHNRVFLHKYQECRVSRMNTEYFEFWKTKKVQTEERIQGC